MESPRYKACNKPLEVLNADSRVIHLPAYQEQQKVQELQAIRGDLVSAECLVRRLQRWSFDSFDGHLGLFFLRCVELVLSY